MAAYCEFDVSLIAIKPRIWRRFQLVSTATFDHLHRAIQAAFGWESYHLWEFRAPDRHGHVLAGAEQDVLFLDAEETPDAQQVKLAEYFKADLSPPSCEYIYDFGDTWIHTVKLIRRLSVAERFHRRLLAGERAGPPEDSGGIGGYARLVEFLETGADPLGDDAAELAEWIGDWKPDRFDFDAAKRIFDR